MRTATSAAQAPLVPVVASSAWMATVLNAPLWRELVSLDLLKGPMDWVLAVALAVVIGGVLVALLSLMASRWTLKPRATPIPPPR